MTNKIIAALALTLAGCSVPQPRNTEVDPPPGAGLAIEIALVEWSERLSAQLDPADLPLIRWFEGRCLDYGDMLEGCVTGAGHWAPLDEEIHIAVRPAIADTSLAHELLHWGLEHTDGDRDGDHHGHQWHAVDDVRDVLTLAGL